MINISFLSERQLRMARLALLIFVFAAIPLTLYLIRHPQIFKGRAFGNPPLEFLGPNVSEGTPPRATNQNVQLKLTYIR